ncbi:hypothetical protein NA57DRAFT_61848 [Rhizodiscina lignyota]|uniref:Uncharacterized protein n=1 Tax=Rhizodiscina lignyota TaxID=1504668 RepID=A0A9P4I5U8_9PEZI|nr:hypothetical protein NA57DRAFT_61848 [Rhizodiscina lignyota]
MLPLLEIVVALLIAAVFCLLLLWICVVRMHEGYSPSGRWAGLTASCILFIVAACLRVASLINPSAGVAAAYFAVEQLEDAATIVTIVVLWWSLSGRAGLEHRHLLLAILSTVAVVTIVLLAALVGVWLRGPAYPAPVGSAAIYVEITYRIFSGMTIVTTAASFIRIRLVLPSDVGIVKAVAIRVIPWVLITAIFIHAILDFLDNLGYLWMPAIVGSAVWMYTTIIVLFVLRTTVMTLLIATTRALGWFALSRGPLICSLTLPPTPWYAIWSQITHAGMRRIIAVWAPILRFLGRDFPELDRSGVHMQGPEIAITLDDGLGMPALTVMPASTAQGLRSRHASGVRPDDMV